MHFIGLTIFICELFSFYMNCSIVIVVDNINSMCTVCSFGNCFGALYAQRCSPSANLVPSGFDRHDFIYPGFSFRCELWTDLVLFQIASHSGPSTSVWAFPEVSSLRSSLLLLHLQHSQKRPV